MNTETLVSQVKSIYLTAIPCFYEKCGYVSRTNSIVKHIPHIAVIQNPLIPQYQQYVNGTTRIENEVPYLFWTINNIIELIYKNKIKTIIIPSNSNNFLTFYPKVKDIAGLELIYEIRGLWYLSSFSKTEISNGKLIPYKKLPKSLKEDEAGEIQAITLATKLIFITDEVRNFLINVVKIPNLVNKDYEIVYNAFDSPPTTIANIPNIDNNNNNNNNSDKTKHMNYFTIGFFDNITQYEWINSLIEVCKELIESQQLNVKLLLIGNNNVNLDLNHKFIDYRVWIPNLTNEYNDLDLYCIPRYPYLISELITPLKPFEALYHKVPLLTSDCACLKTLSNDGKNFMLFKKGDKKDLKNKILLISKQGYDKQLIINGYDHIINEKNWVNQCKKIHNLINRSNIIPLSITKRKILLIAGHDLKFIKSFFQYFEQSGFEIIIDLWEGHNKHREAESIKLLRRADVIFCEWMLGNAIWYGKHKLNEQRLFGRFHLQELDHPLFSEIQFQKFEKILFVSPYILEQAIQKNSGIKTNGIVIYNGVDVDKLQSIPRGKTYGKVLGIVGIVPQRKRFDLALNILEQLRKVDCNYILRVKGKLPKDYPWMKNRLDEMAWFEQQFQRIKKTPALVNGVIFDQHGDNMPEWYAGIDYVLSTSDFESFHFTIADGTVAGCIPIIFPWKGSDEIYPKEWILNNVSEAVAAIQKVEDNQKFINYSASKFHMHIIAEQIINKIT